MRLFSIRTGKRLLGKTVSVGAMDLGVIVGVDIVRYDPDGPCGVSLTLDRDGRGHRVVIDIR